MILERINEPQDIKNLTYDEMQILAGEIREFLISTISQTGGHLASNLGVVELTIALYRVFDLPRDKVIWDVGHQAYTHKILSGRKEGFGELRQYGGMSGYRTQLDLDLSRPWHGPGERYSGRSIQGHFRDRRRRADGGNGIRSPE